MRPLSVQFQRDQLCLWYEVKPMGEQQTVEVIIFGTGHLFPAELDHETVFVGTAQDERSQLVWHVFCRVIL